MGCFFALCDRAAAEEAGPAWQPADKAFVYSRLDAAYRNKWEGADLDRIAAAMANWNGDERWEGLNRGGLSAHKSAKLKGMRTAAARSKGRAPPDRWTTYSIVFVAQLLKQRWAELRRALELEGMDEANELPTDAELLAVLSERCKQLEANVLEIRAERDAARDGWRKAAARMKAKEPTIVYESVNSLGD